MGCRGEKIARRLVIDIAESSDNRICTLSRQIIPSLGQHPAAGGIRHAVRSDRFDEDCYEH